MIKDIKNKEDILNAEEFEQKVICQEALSILIASTKPDAKDLHHQDIAAIVDEECKTNPDNRSMVRHISNTILSLMLDFLPKNYPTTNWKKPIPNFTGLIVERHEIPNIGYFEEYHPDLFALGNGLTNLIKRTEYHRLKAEVIVYAHVNKLGLGKVM